MLECWLESRTEGTHSGDLDKIQCKHLRENFPLGNVLIELFCFFMFTQEETRETLKDLPAVCVSSINCPVISFANSVSIHHFFAGSACYIQKTLMSQSSC